MSFHNQRLIASGGVLSAMLLLAACSGTADPEPSAGPDEGDQPAAEGSVDLASVCPNPIVVQTSWLPAAERAWYYALIGPDGTADGAAGTYSGPAAVDPSIDVEVRAGGPAVGFQDSGSLLYSDPDILIADQNLDAMIAQSEAFPTVGVMAPLVKHPQILMWGPDAHQFEDIEDIKESGATVVVAENAVYADVLVGRGKLDAAQIDKSYDFSPARFVATDGEIVQQGFATSEPYTYAHDVAEWAKPIDYLLLADNGYPNYGVVASVRPEKVTEYGECLNRLVPVLQQAVVDYAAEPEAMNARLAELTVEFNSASPTSAEENAAATESMLSLGMIGDSSPGVLGGFDMDRVEEMISITTPVFEAQNSRTYDPDLTAEDLVTNEFIDDSIGLPANS